MLPRGGLPVQIATDELLLFTDESKVLEAFLGQFYQDRPPPAQIVISHSLNNEHLMASVFSDSAGRKISIQAHPRGDRRKMLELAVGNSRQALQMRLASKANMTKQF